MQTLQAFGKEVRRDGVRSERKNLAIRLNGDSVETVQEIHSQESVQATVHVVSENRTAPRHENLTVGLKNDVGSLQVCGDHFASSAERDIEVAVGDVTGQSNILCGGVSRHDDLAIVLNDHAGRGRNTAAEVGGNDSASAETRIDATVGVV